VAEYNGEFKTFWNLRNNSASLPKILDDCQNMIQKHTKYTEINTNKCMHSELSPM